jgi:hypothetical protein
MDIDIIKHEHDKDLLLPIPISARTKKLESNLSNSEKS